MIYIIVFLMEKHAVYFYIEGAAEKVSQFTMLVKSIYNKNFCF
jgi:hypothetical protein